MAGRRLRGLLFLAALGGLGWWIYETRPTIPGLVDSLTRPILGSRAAVSTSERKRVVGDATEVLAVGEERKGVGSLQEGMTESEVRRLLGDPDRIETVVVKGALRVHWIYGRAGRDVVFDRRRVVSIAVR